MCPGWRRPPTFSLAESEVAPDPVVSFGVSLGVSGVVGSAEPSRVSVVESCRSAYKWPRGSPSFANSDSGRV